MVIDPKVRQNRIKQMTHLYELITKENEEDKEILYKTLKALEDEINIVFNNTVGDYQLCDQIYKNFIMIDNKGE